MRSRTRRLSIMAGMALAGGIVLSGPGSSCTSFIAESALQSADFCFIFDCVNSSLGGTLDPCSGFGGETQTAETLAGVSVFTDCTTLAP